MDRRRGPGDGWKGPAAPPGPADELLRAEHRSHRKPGHPLGGLRGPVPDAAGVRSGCSVGQLQRLDLPHGVVDLVEPAVVRLRRAVRRLAGAAPGPSRCHRAAPRAEQGAQPGSGGMSRRGLWIGLSLAAVTAVLLFVLAKGFGRDPHEVPFQLRGKPAPDFTLRRLDTGEPVRLSDLKGKPIVLNFWASWCGPCKMEHPVVAMAARRFGQEYQFFGVVFEDTEENARAFAGASDPSFPQLIDERSRMAVDYGVTGVPETYFIDANGILRDKVAFPIDPRTMMEKLAALKQPPGPVSEVVR